MAKKNSKSDNARKKNLLSNPQWELFCQIYAFDRQYSGNATHAYAIAFKVNLEELPTDDDMWEGGYDDKESGVYIPKKKIQPSSYDRAVNLCAVNGHHLLRKANIEKRLQGLYLSILEDTVVDSRLAEHITQREDRGLSIQAIREYNKLRNRIKTKIEIVEPEVDEETRDKAKGSIRGFIARKVAGQG